MTLASDLETPAVTIPRGHHGGQYPAGAGAPRGVTASANRPHIKTHKIPAIGKMQMAAGAMGITCQKLGEVEVFVDAGVADDILLTYNILGRAKTDRLMALIRRAPGITVALDNEVVARELSEAGGAPRARRALSRRVRHGLRAHRRADSRGPPSSWRVWRARLPKMQFRGLMTFPNREPTTREFFERALALFAGAGIPVPVVSGGGTPTIFTAQNIPMLTEHRAGTCVFNDAMVVSSGTATWDKLRHAGARDGGEPPRRRAGHPGCGHEGAHLRSVRYEGLRPCDGVSGGRRRQPLRGARGRRPLGLRRAAEGG